MPNQAKTAAPPRKPPAEKPPAPPTEPNQITQEDRAVLLSHPDAKTLRKTARIVAVEMAEPFTVETDRGTMAGGPGDFLATNHPDDDPGSDMWTISKDRIAFTYTEDDGSQAVEEARQKGFDDGYVRGLADGKAGTVIGTKEQTEPRRVTVNAWWCGICDNSQPLTYKACVKCGTPRTDLPT